MNDFDLQKMKLSSSSKEEKASSLSSSIGVTEPNAPPDIIRLLTYLLSPYIPADKKKEVLSTEFKIEMTEPLYEEIDNMSNVAETLIRKGFEEGFEKGIEKTAKEMLKRNIPVIVISECTGLTIDEIKNLDRSK